MMKMLPVRQATAPSRSRLRLTQPQLQAEPRPLGSGRRASVYFRGRLRLVHPRPARTCLHQWWGMLQLANARLRAHFFSSELPLGCTRRTLMPLPDDLFQQVLDRARALGVTQVEAILSQDTQALTRFANNAIHQNVAERSTQLSVRPVIEGRTARATTNRLDRAGIRDVVAEAVALTRLNESDADLPPLAEPAEIEDVQRYFEATAQA